MADMHEEMAELLESLCHTEEQCGECLNRRCLVGHSKYVNEATKEMKPPHLRGASESRPLFDMRGGYDEELVLRLLAKTLVYCRGCLDNHKEDCFLAVIRNNMEMFMFGEEIPYEGNPLSYLVKAGTKDSTKGAALSELYNVEKNA